MILKITKRDGVEEKYNPSKIGRAIKAAFKSIKTPCTQEILNKLISDIEIQLEALAKTDSLKVEQIQDIVEIELMKSGYYREARCFILYREERAHNRAIFEEIEQTVTQEGIHRVLKDIQKDLPQLSQSLNKLLMKYRSFHKATMTPDESLQALIRSAVECITAEEPDWEFVAGRLLSFHSHLAINRKMSLLKITSFYEKIRYMDAEGYYGKYMLENYDKEEINELATYIKPERNHLFTYSGLDLLLRRYTIRTYTHELLETPQEMFMGIAMHLAINEKKEVRLKIVHDIYDILSKLQVTMATPTMSNARKPFHQLSSCFIDTVPDSLDGIYRSINNFAQVSKHGGGMGLYFGKVRANGSDIRGYKGAAGGVVRWIKLANDTAVAVDQLGVRAGAVACYLDVWHKDILDFLQLRTNNGDDRMKAHDIFPAVCYPDLFWKMVKEDINQSWYMMCPHEIKTIKNYELEDYYGEEWEKRYQDCVNDSRISKTKIVLKDLIRLILKSAIETGTPFAFFRDAVNRANPNKHKGIIYSSNLCVEIAQNMAPIETISTQTETVDGETIIVERTRPGDFVVCNLSSLVISKIDFNNNKEVEHILRTIVRALDNVIDLNYYPVEYARITNRTYRPIGLGIMGYHHFLANKGIAWESEEHLKIADEVLEKINYYAIKASNELAEEKGTYSYFEGSDWQTKEYFNIRQYNTPEWQYLAGEVAKKGMRNGYLLAVAPTSSTSIIAGTTACTDPIMNRFFLEEKKGTTIARVAPDLNTGNWWLYKSAYQIDQLWSIRAAGIRQRHVDQSQSINLYITNDYSFRQILNLYLEAWECGLKTIYYVRSKSLEVEECESCAS